MQKNDRRIGSCVSLKITTRVEAFKNEPQEYISRLDDLDPDWRGKEPEAERSWVAISTLAQDSDPYLDADSKSVFDWAKESDATRWALIFVWILYVYF
jgi:hypothetical protein